MSKATEPSTTPWNDDARAATIADVAERHGCACCDAAFIGSEPLAPWCWIVISPDNDDQRSLCGERSAALGGPC